MKIDKLLLKTFIIVLVLATSGTAMAQRAVTRNCGPDGTVSRATVLGNLVIEGDCIVYLTTVHGNIRVNNDNLASNESVVILRDVVVGGHIRVEGGILIMRDNIVAVGNVVVKNTKNANVSDTLVHSGNMRFEDNDTVHIISNFVGAGNIRCVSLNFDQVEFASQNNVPNGVVTCFGQ